MVIGVCRAHQSIVILPLNVAARACGAIPANLSEPAQETSLKTFSILVYSSLDELNRCPGFSPEVEAVPRWLVVKQLKEIKKL